LQKGWPVGGVGDGGNWTALLCSFNGLVTQGYPRWRFALVRGKRPRELTFLALLMLCCCSLYAIRLSLGSITCKALYDIVVVDADDTVLSFHNVSLFLFPIRMRLPVGTGHRTALAFGFITCI
jgi:hypothetical protein